MPPKNKKQQVAKTITLRKGQGRRVNTQLIVAPTNRAVRSVVSSSQARRQEMVIEVKKQTDNKAQEFVLHPKEIPWFGGIAPSYQKWGMKDLRVWYEPRVATSTNGTVSMAILPDFKDATPISFQSLTSIKGAVRGAPWDRFTLTCPKFRAYDYIKDLSQLSDEDRNGRAVGRIVVLADVDTTDTIVGRIFLEYTPVFIDPIDPRLQDPDFGKVV